MTIEQAATQEHHPLVYTPLAEQEWADALSLVGGEEGYQATIIEGSLYLTPARENEIVDPNEVFYAALRQDRVRNPAAGGRHYLTRAELDEIEAGRTFKAIHITESLDASRPLPAMIEGSDGIRAERTAAIFAATQYVDVRRPDPITPPEPPRLASPPPAVPPPGFMTTAQIAELTALATSRLSLQEAVRAGILAPAKLHTPPRMQAETAPEPPTETTPEAPSQCQAACPDCPFAGGITDFSMRTARISAPQAWEGDALVTYVENEGQPDERRAGEVIIAGAGDSYGTGDDYRAASAANRAIRDCATYSRGPLHGRKWLGLRAVTACAAFNTQQGSKIRPRRHILHITNALPPEERNNA